MQPFLVAISRKGISEFSSCARKTIADNDYIANAKQREYMQEFLRYADYPVAAIPATMPTQMTKRKLIHE